MNGDIEPLSKAWVQKYRKYEGVYQSYVPFDDVASLPFARKRPASLLGALKLPGRASMVPGASMFPGRVGLLPGQVQVTWLLA
jgi:hypothetical protein